MLSRMCCRTPAPGPFGWRSEMVTLLDAPARRQEPMSEILERQRASFTADGPPGL